MELQEKCKAVLTAGAAAPAQVPGDIPHGDMPGDKIRIGEEHIRKANTLFPGCWRSWPAPAKAGRWSRSTAAPG